MEDPLDEVGRMIAFMQSRVLATEIIMVELMRRLAREQADPAKFLAGIYEDALHRCGEGHAGEKAAITGTRTAIEAFFANQMKWLAADRGSPSPEARPE
ncbi:MAG: hypothetical protein KBC46_03340 [Ferrovibrio sp.]|nr:hypothetical protein [Ferrovibrio sp.]